MGIHRRFRHWLAAGLVILLGLLIAGSQVVEAATARIVSISVDPDSLELLLTLEGGAFDPVLWVEETGKGSFSIIIEGENARFADTLEDDTLSLNRNLTAAIREVRSVSLLQQKGNGNTIRIVLEAGKRLRPQVRSNTGDRVTIALVGATRGEAAPREEVRQETLSVVTLDKPDKTANQEKEPPHRPVQRPAAPALTSAPADTSSASFSVYSLGEATDVAGEVRQAWFDYRDGRLDSARMALETWLGQNSRDPVARYLLGLVHLADDEKQRAALALQKVTEESPRFLPAWVELVKLNLSEGHFSETAELLRQAFREFPDEPELLYARGLLEEARGQVDDALKTYLAALSGNPHHLLAHYRLAIVELKRNRPASAAVELRRLILANPDDIAAFKALGYAYHREEETDRAAEAYLRALKPDVLINYAGLLNEDHRTQEALTLYRAAELLSAEDANLQYNLGMIYADLNQPQRALASLNRFIELARGEDDATSRERLEKARAKIRALEPAPPEIAPRKSSSATPAPEKMDYRFAVSAGNR